MLTSCVNTNPLRFPTTPYLEFPGFLVQIMPLTHVGPQFRLRTFIILCCIRLNPRLKTKSFENLNAGKSFSVISFAHSAFLICLRQWEAWSWWRLVLVVAVCCFRCWCRWISAVLVCGAWCRYLATSRCLSLIPTITSLIVWHDSRIYT